MNELFVDTSGWAVFLVRSESFHSKARTAIEELRRAAGSVVTTNYLMAELVALMTSPLRIPRTEQIRIIGTLRSSEWIKIIHIGQIQDQRAWELLMTHHDKIWSLADCASLCWDSQSSFPWKSEVPGLPV